MLLFSCHKCHKDQNKCHFASVAQFGTRYYTKWSSTTYILIFCDMCVYIFTEIFPVSGCEIVCSKSIIFVEAFA